MCNTSLVESDSYNRMGFFERTEEGINHWIGSSGEDLDPQYIKREIQ